MTERPKPFVREAVVVTSLFLGSQPDASEAIRRFSGRHSDLAYSIHRLMVGTAASVTNPKSTAMTENRLKRGNQAAGWALNFDLLAFSLVNVGLAIGNDH